MGILKGNQSKYSESLEYFYKALSRFEKINTEYVQKSIGSCYENIGTIHNLTNNYEKAIVNYKRAISVLQKIKNQQVDIAMNIANLGVIYHKQGKNQQAIKTFKIAEKELSRTNSEFSLAFVNSWMGETYLALNNIDESIKKSKNALSAVSKSGDKDLTARTIQNIGYGYLKKGIMANDNKLLDLGLSKLSEALKMHKELGNQEAIIKDYKYFSEYYSFKKDYKKSLENYVAYSTYKDSVFNFKNKQSLQNLEDQRTISLRDKQIELNKITLDNKEKQTWYFIAGLLLLITIGSLLYYQSNNRKKTNQKLQILNAELDTANKTKTRFFNILNHDLRSPVANLIHFLHLQKNSPELLDETSKIRMENKTISGAENLLNSMEDILLWSKGQMENFKPVIKNTSVASMFEDTEKHFLSNDNIKISFENLENLQLNTDENYLKTIIRNLTGNAIKALANTQNPTIIWKAWQENEQNFLSIHDNGPGANQEQFKALYDEKEVVGIQSGLGLHLIRDLAKAINCEIKVSSETKLGTAFTLLIQ